MSNTHLTDLLIRQLPSKASQYDVYDAKETGLGIRISPKGAKTFFFWFRLGRKGRRLTLGRYPTISLADARKLAQDSRRQVALGADPAAERKNARDTVADRLFSAALVRYEEEYPARPSRAWTETKRTLRREFFATWKNVRIADISRNDVRTSLRVILNRGTPSAANHAFVALRTFFNWCVREELATASPCVGVTMPSPTRSRDRVLTDDEILAVWNAAGTVGYPFGPLVRLLILTAQRRDEVAGMQWSHIDDKAAQWTISENKSRRTHILPMTQAAMNIVSTIPRCHAEYMFPARGKNRPVSGFSKWKRVLDEICGVTNWTLHDLRRTAASRMAEMQVEPYVIEKILNHTSGSLGGVAGIYNRYGYDQQMRNGLEKWASRIANLASTGV